MNHRVINAQPRVETTKGGLRALRAEGKIPAVVYGGGSPAAQIALDAVEFQKSTAGITESTILTLAVGGKQTEVFVRERQRDALTNAIIHVDFLEIVKGRSLHAKVPIHLVGSAIGVRNGGILENPAHEVEVECDPRYLPEQIDLDISGLEANHSIHVRDIPAIPNVKILTNAELVLAVVKFAKAEVVEAAAVEEAAPGAVAAPGAPAAPGAAAPGAAGAPAAGKAAAPTAGKKEEKK